MKPISKITSFILLLVFLFSAAPKELVHEFFHEHESTDFICGSGTGEQLSVQHNHCDLLQLNHPPAYSSVKTFSFAVNEHLFLQKSAIIQEYHFCSIPILFLRGPPRVS